jgi:hypothetical protein
MIEIATLAVAFGLGWIIHRIIHAWLWVGNTYEDGFSAGRSYERHQQQQKEKQP